MTYYFSKPSILCLLILSACCQTSYSQPVTIKNLALEGGGIRGIAFTGAIDSLAKSGSLDSLETIAGTSAGGIVAALLAVGYRNDEIEDILRHMKFSRFNDNRFSFISGGRRLVKQFGWYKGDRLERFFESLIAKKTGIPHFTFTQLYGKHEQNPKVYKLLYITATDLSAQRSVILSHLNFPNMPLSTALRITTSIPFYYKPVFMDSAGKNYRKPQAFTHVMVDGGMLLNYPMPVFHHTDSAGKVVLLPASYGIKLDDPAQLEHERNNKGLAPVDIHSFSDFARAFYLLNHENLNKIPLVPEDDAHTIHVSTCNIGPRIKKLKQQQVDILVNSGKAGVGEFLRAVK